MQRLSSCLPYKEKQKNCILVHVAPVRDTDAFHCKTLTKPIWISLIFGIVEVDAYISIGRYVKDKLTTVRAVLKTDLTNGIGQRKSRSCGHFRALSCSCLT